MEQAESNSLMAVKDTVTEVYQAPANCTFASITINCSNNGTTADGTAVVSVARHLAATPAEANWIEPSAVVPVGGVLERSCMILQPSERLSVRTNTTKVAVNIWGLAKIPE